MEFMAMGGWAMWLVLMLDGVLLPVVLIVCAAVIAMRITSRMPGLSKALAVLTLAACLLPAFAGVFGYWLGATNVEAALAHVQPEYADELREAGYEEASYNLKFGGGSTCVLASLALIGVAVSMTQRASYDVE